MLFSFHYYKSFDMRRYLGDMPYRPSVFVDSGGFSAFTQGSKVSLRDYVSWLRRNGDVFDHYANLDEIGDPRGTLMNQLRMEQMGMRPMPVVHVGTSPDEIRAYKRRGYTYQCLGGMVPHMKGVGAALRRGDEDHHLLRWLDECHTIAAEEGVKLHGFGATTWLMIKRYPWRSVDSSSWASAYRFGQGSIFDHRVGRWLAFPLRDKTRIMTLAPLIRSYGANPLSLIRDDKHSRKSIIALSAKSWLAAQRWLQDRGHEVESLFLASTSTSEAPTAAKAMSSTRVFLAEAAHEHLTAASKQLLE